MSLEVLSILGGGNSGSSETNETGGSHSANGSGGTAESGGAGSNSGATSSSGQTEAAYAVQPTPVTAKAAKVDLSGEKVSGGVTFEYPISGPDKFARAVAEQARSEAEVRELVAKIEEAPEVAEIGLDAEELRGPAEDDAVDAKATDDKDNQGVAASDKADDTSDIKESGSFALVGYASGNRI